MVQGSGDGEFAKPSCIATYGTVYYVVDVTNNRVQKFSSDGTFLLKFGVYGTGDGQFISPAGVCVSADGSLVFVADQSNHRIQVFGSDGTFLSKFGTYGSGDGELNNPCGVATDPSGNVYVADLTNNRIQKFATDGTFLAKVSTAGFGDGTYYGPRAVAFNAATGELYVGQSTTGTGRILVFSASLDYIRQFGTYGTGDGQFKYLTAMNLSGDGSVFTTEEGSGTVGINRVQKFTPSGIFIKADLLLDLGGLNRPGGIAIDPAGDVYVSDWMNYRVVKFTPDASYTYTPPAAPVGLYPCWSTFVRWKISNELEIPIEVNCGIDRTDYPTLRTDFADLRLATYGDSPENIPYSLTDIVTGESATLHFTIQPGWTSIWLVAGNPDGDTCGGGEYPPEDYTPTGPDPTEIDPEVVESHLIKTLRGKSTINTDKSATAVYEVCVPSELRGVYKNLSESVLAGLYKIYSPVEGSTTARYDILSPVPKVIEAKYDISSPVEKVLSGLYSIADPVAKVLQGIYAILVPSVVAPLRARYNIGDPVTLRGKYNVAPPPFSAQFVVQIKDKSFITVVDDHDLTVNLDQLPHYTCTFRDPPALYRDYYIVEGNEIRVLYNTGVLFSGIITGTERVSGTNNIAVEAWGMAKALEALKIQSKQQFVTTPANEIAEALLPDEWEGEIDEMPSISYTTEYGDILTHIANLASITGRDWAARQTQVILAVDDIIEETTTTTLVVSGATLAESPDDDCPIGRYVFATGGAARYTGALVTDNTENTLVVSGEPFGRLAIGDHIVVYLRHRLDLTERPATGTPLFKSFKNVGIRNIKRTKDLEKVYSVIVVPGASSMAANQSSVFPVVTLPAHWAETTATESMLADQGTDICLSATATSIILADASGYAASGIVCMEAEDVYYAGKSGNTLTGCVRGANGTVAAAHNIFCPVLFRSEYPMANTSFLPASGSVWIGMECLSYTGKSDVGLLGLSRGVGSRAYPHGSGAVVRDASYTVAAPETGSPYALYGERALNVPAVGAVDQHTLDVVAQTYAKFSTSLTEWGTGKFLHRALPNNVQVGDYFAIGERIDGEIVDTTYRLVGIRLDGESSRLSFGETEEFILDRLRGIDKAMDMAGIKDDKPGIGTVAGVSCNKEVLKVLMPDGTYTYSRLK